MGSRGCTLCVLVWCAAYAFPATAQPLVVDGGLNDSIWREVAAQRLVPSEAGVPAGRGVRFAHSWPDATST